GHRNHLPPGTLSRSSPSYPRPARAERHVVGRPATSQPLTTAAPARSTRGRMARRTGPNAPTGHTVAVANLASPQTPPGVKEMRQMERIVVGVDGSEAPCPIVIIPTAA